MNLTKCILAVFFITNITSCTVTSYETLKATSGGFPYEYVTDDPVGQGEFHSIGTSRNGYRDNARRGE